MTTLLASTIVRHSPANQPSGYLYRIVMDEEPVIDQFRMPEPTLRNLDQNPRGGMRGVRGIAYEGDCVFVASFDAVNRFDVRGRLVNSFSDPSCADIHDICVRNGEIWATSTRNDSLTGFDADSQVFDRVRATVDGSVVKDSNYACGVDYRDPRTHDKTCSDHLHLSSLATRGDGVRFLMYGFFCDGCSGTDESLAGGRSAIVRLEGEGSASIIRLSECSIPSHNLVFDKHDRLWTNDTSAGRLLAIDPDSGTEMIRVSVPGGYLRGLCVLSDGRIAVGCQNEIVFCDPDEQAVSKRIRVSANSNESVFAIQEIPVELTGWQPKI